MVHPVPVKSSFIAVLAATLLASGCSMNPYVRSDSLKSSLPAATETTSSFYGDLPKAIADVEAQRLAYVKKLEARTIQRNLLSSSLIGLTAAALYQGVNAAAGSAGRSVANLGAAAGGAYALGNYSNNPPTELAYINAANDLTCLVMRTRPWLLTTVDHAKFTSSVADLLTKTDAMDKEYQKQVALSSDRTAFLKKTGFERSMHAKARTTLRKASNFEGYVNTAGFQLKNEANLVKNVADFEIHRNQLDLVNPKDALAGIRGTSQAFRDIKPLEVTPADAQKDADDEPKTNDMSDGVTTPNSATPQVTPTKTKVDASSTASTASSELGKQADKLTQQITALSSQQAAQEKANDKRATATGKKLKELTDELKSLTVVVTALNASQTASLTVAISRPDTKAAEELALKLSDVLAAMRPVNAVLTRAYSLKPFVKNIPECQPLHAQYFEFAFDAEEVELNPGQSFDVALKGGVGVPRVWLSGAKSTDKGDSAVLTTTIDGGIARAKLKLAADAPAGEMYIMAIDGSGRFKDSIKVVVVMPASPSKNK